VGGESIYSLGYRVALPKAREVTADPSRIELKSCKQKDFRDCDPSPELELISIHCYRQFNESWLQNDTVRVLLRDAPVVWMS
jgi:hypothetical protein